MRTAQPDKRTRLIETATKLAYGRGFRQTSLADIAEAARVPVGNVYYYFKTKEELAEAVVERLLEEFRAEMVGDVQMRHRIEPQSRLKQLPIKLQELPDLGCRHWRQQDRYRDRSYL